MKMDNLTSICGRTLLIILSWTEFRHKVYKLFDMFHQFMNTCAVAYCML